MSTHRWNTLFWILVMALPFYFTHQKLIHHPFEYHLEDTYDGFRSHAATAYYLKHNPDYLHFEGMNYPYGDRIEYADVQTAFLIPIKVLVNLGLVDADAGPGLLQLFVLLSFWVGAVAIFILLRRWKLPQWYAAIVGIAMMLLSPQVLRLEAHYGLSHAAVIPVLILLLYQYHLQPTWKWSTAIGLYLLWTAFIHQYFFAMGGALVGLYGVIQWLFAPQRVHRKQRFFHLIIQTLIPLILLLSFLKIGDSVVDRTSKPWGFFAYHASWPTVFLPLKYKEGEYVYNHWIGGGYLVSNEGTSFIGVATLILMIVAMSRWVWINLRRRSTRTLAEPFSFLQPLLGASVIVLLLAFGLPFSISAFESYLSYMGPWQQFRSMGRFAWIFYYILNLFVWYSLWDWVGKKIWTSHGWSLIGRILLFLLPLIGLFAESIDFDHDYGNTPLYPAPEHRDFFKEADRPWLKEVDTSAYQAVLSLPFYHIGSDNLWFSPSEKTPHVSLWTSVQTGLPSISSFMGRTSISQMLSLASIQVNEYYPPKAFEEMGSDKKILGIAYRKSYETMQHEFKHILEGCTKWYEDDQTLVFDLRPSKYLAIQQRRRESAIALVDSLATDSLEYLYQSFDDQRANGFHGNGHSISVEQPNTWFRQTLPKSLRDTALQVSFWQYINEDMAPKSVWRIEILDQSGSKIWEAQQNLRYHIQEIVEGWALIEVHVPQPNGSYDIQISLENREMDQPVVTIDEVFVRPTDQSTGFRKGAEVFFNGRWLVE